MKCLRTRRRTCRRSPTTHNLSRLKQSEEDFQQSLLQAKANYETSLINSFTFGSTSVIYRYICSLSKTKSIPCTVYLETITASCDESKAKLFNYYFHSVFNKSSQPIPNLDVTQQQHNSLSSFPALSLLLKLKFWKFFHNWTLPKQSVLMELVLEYRQHCAMSLSRPLCHLFNLSLSTGSIPQEWKCI